jgi:hypothetical protein
MMYAAHSASRNHHATLAAWRQLVIPQDAASQLTQQELAELEEVASLQLLKPGDTRFASAFIMLERVKKVKGKLRQYAVADEFEAAISNMKPKDQVRKYAVVY